MLSLFAPQGPDFPMVWWVWWFVVAFALYGLLGAWFWISMRRDEASAAGKSHGETSDRH